MTNKITLFILDDNIYKSQDFVEKSIYDSKINSELLLQLTNNYEWKGQHNLQELTSSILKSNHAQLGNIITYGFTHPSICLDAIDSGLKPNVVIFDWEYGSESNKESSNWLMEILNLTNSFIFVYSMVRNEIPPFLNKQEFDKHADHFQLFLKGDDKESIFSSEEFILQYVLSRVSRSNQIKLSGLQIDFNENGYLKNPTDILYLEKIFGRNFIIEQLKGKNVISNEAIESLIEKAKGKLLFDSKRNYLITPDSTLFIEKFKPDVEISYLEALKKYGLTVLKEALEVGLKKV